MKGIDKTGRALCHCGDAFTDYQREHMRNIVCRNLPVKYEHAQNLYCIFHFPQPDKQDEFELALSKKLSQKNYQFYGTWFPQSVEFSSHEFSAWANFEWVTFNADANFDAAKFLDNCVFIAATFKGKASFSRALFSKSKHHDFSTSFYAATFEGEADFKNAEFKTKVEFERSRFLAGASSSTDISLGLSATPSFAYAKFFDEASFTRVSFGDPDKAGLQGSMSFIGATFDGLANFQSADFLLSAHFGQAVFRKTADFRDTSVKTSLGFQGASFEGFGKFSGKNKRHRAWSKNALGFSSVDIEKSEKISFQTLELRPDSFINTDVRKFDFTDIKWKTKSFAFDWSRCKHFLFWNEAAKEARSNYELLEVAYRRLAANAEDSNQYRDASNLRYTAFDIQRINRWYGRLPVTLLWWYKWTSRYGESWLWTAFVLIIILAASTYAYSQVDFYVCPLDRPIAQSSANGMCAARPLSWYEASRHSLATATFQNVEYRKPTTDNGEVFVLLEKILAPIQAALLALAIRRKVMR
jgi:hypothetical protein